MKYLLPILLLLGSCTSMRVFQEKVPEPIQKTDSHINEEKRGAYYLAINTTHENKVVADALSRSLGTPTTIKENPNEIAETLFAETSAYENGMDALNTKLENYQGKEIEGTGWNIMPLFSGVGIILIVVLLVLFPSLITLLFFVLKRTRGALGNIVTGIKEFSDNDPNKAKDLNELLERKLDRAEKKLKYRMESNG